MEILRKIKIFIFMTLFFCVLIFYMLLSLPLFFVHRKALAWIFTTLMKTQGVLHRLFGIEIEVRGREHLPQGGYLVASKHQSMWETFMLVPIFEDLVFVYKHELDKIPVFGAYLRKLGMVSVDRGKGSTAMRDMASGVSRAISQGLQVLIFPEGTRRPPGSPPRYKQGIFYIYENCNVPVVPIALNSGLLWPGASWNGHRGKIVVHILPVIPASLPREEFAERLQNDLETASDDLLLEVPEADIPNLPPMARERIADLRALRDPRSA